MFDFIPVDTNMNRDDDPKRASDFSSNGNSFYVFDKTTEQNLGIIVEQGSYIYVIPANNKPIQFNSREEAAIYLQEN